MKLRPAYRTQKDDFNRAHVTGRLQSDGFILQLEGAAYNVLLASMRCLQIPSLFFHLAKIGSL